MLDFGPSLWKEGMLGDYHFSDEQDGKAMPYYSAYLALEEAKKRIEHKKTYYIKEYNYEDVCSTWGDEKTREFFLFENEKKQIEQSKQKQTNNHLFSFFPIFNNPETSESKEQNTSLPKLGGHESN